MHFGLIVDRCEGAVFVVEKFEWPIFWKGVHYRYSCDGIWESLTIESNPLTLSQSHAAYIRRGGWPVSFMEANGVIVFSDLERRWIAESKKPDLIGVPDETFDKTLRTLGVYHRMSEALRLNRCK